MAKALLELENVDFSYSDSDSKVLENFSLVVKNGEKILIQGPNGSGKTTLLKIIMGLLKPDKGVIKRSENLSIAYCKQDFANNKFPISAYEVVSMGSKNKEEIKKAMILTDSWNLKDRSFFSLSGGEKQRVSLARCFCQQANLLLLDEPSSFLDSRAKTVFRELMQKLPDYMAAIVVTHDSDLAKTLNWNCLSLNKKEKNL